MLSLLGGGGAAKLLGCWSGFAGGGGVLHLTLVAEVGPLTRVVTASLPCTVVVDALTFGDGTNCCSWGVT